MLSSTAMTIPLQAEIWFASIHNSRGSAMYSSCQSTLTFIKEINVIGCAVLPRLLLPGRPTQSPVTFARLETL